MSLEKYRDLLRNRLRLGTAFKTANIPVTMRTVEHWWAFYKAWEAQDTFLGAFKEGRMTVRQIPVPKGMERKKVDDIGDYDITYGEYEGKQSGTNFGTWRFEKEGQHYPEERYRVGTKALKERLQPANFGMDHGERLKYKHGLHDMSASLCVPTIPLLTKQVRWKWGELAIRITVFMPLAKQEDMYLFYLLNAAAKQERDVHPQIYLQIANMRKRMTRIKLADSNDIGAGLRDISERGSTNPKFRYGMKDTPADQERLKSALNYTSILPKAASAPVDPPISATTTGLPGGPPPPPGPMEAGTTSCNEVVIAYREHAGDRFPLFTKFDSLKRAFVCKADEPGSQRIINKQIPDNWASTVEA